jgi:hypothetical protein
MPQLISIASQAPTTFDTLIASPFDLGNIQDAFMYYHYGVAEKGEEPSPTSINGHLQEIKNNLFSANTSSIELLETYNFALDSSGSLKNINDLDVFERFQNIKKQIYALFNTQGQSYTIQISDNRKTIVINSNSFATISIPPDSQIDFPIGTTIDIINIGTNFFIVQGKETVQIRNEKKIFRKNTGCTIYKRAENDWVVVS